MTSTREQLKEAYRLIRQDQPQDAEQLLRPILEVEPENVHAWWLLAYSVDDPYQVRDALNKVLELDPGYSNASKAREMLTTLEEQFFSLNEGVPEEQPSSVDDEYVPADPFFTEVEAELETEAVKGPGYDEDYSTVDESFFTDSDEALKDYTEPLLELDENTGDDELFSLDDDFDLDSLDVEQSENLLPFLAEDGELDENTDDDDKAAAEERVGRRTGRRGCMRNALLLLLILAVVVVGLVLFLQQDQDAGDPGELVVVSSEVEGLTAVVTATEIDVTSAALGMQQKALLAESPLGDTLFVEFCGESSSDLSQDIALAMQIAAQHAVDVSEIIDAIGVSVNRCDADPHDTLYRAFVPVADAVSYLNGDFGAAQVGWSEFQRRWQKS